MPRGFSRTAHAAWFGAISRFVDLTCALTVRLVREAERSRAIADGLEPAGLRRRWMIRTFAPLAITLGALGVVSLTLRFCGWPKAALIPVVIGIVVLIEAPLGAWLKSRRG